MPYLWSYRSLLHKRMYIKGQRQCRWPRARARPGYTVSREGIRVWRARRCSIILILPFVVSTKPFLLVLSNFFCILLEIVSGSLHYFSFLDIFRKSQSKLKMSKQSKLNTRDIDRA